MTRARSVFWSGPEAFVSRVDVALADAEVAADLLPDPSFLAEICALLAMDALSRTFLESGVEVAPFRFVAVPALPGFLIDGGSSRTWIFRSFLCCSYRAVESRTFCPTSSSRTRTTDAFATIGAEKASGGRWWIGLVGFGMRFLTKSSDRLFVLG